MTRLRSPRPAYRAAERIAEQMITAVKLDDPAGAADLAEEALGSGDELANATLCVLARMAAGLPALPTGR